MKLTTLTLALLAACGPVYAQTNCMPTEQVQITLLEDYGEVPLTMGLAGPGVIVEYWGNPETGTWSIVINRANGISCVPVSGTDMELIPIDNSEPA